MAPPTSTATFDYSADPNYGSVDLAAGFTPDPHRIPTLSGGSVSASYLGGDCTGYATVEPDHEVDYSYQGGPALLRFYFVANDTNEDTTLIINATDASWHCSDDTYGTKNPTVDFPNPAAGTYDIWIGSYASGTNISGTLYITELDSNHP